MSWHKRLLTANPEAGYRQWYYSDPDTGDVALETEQLVQPIIEDAKGRNNVFTGKDSWKGDWHHIAYIPVHVQEYFRLRGVNLLTDRDALKWWLNNRDYSGAFRTRPGRV